MYIKREFEQLIPKAAGQTKVILVTGARQVGKTTLLQQTLGETCNYVSFDDPGILSLARQDPRLFFQQNPLPLIIDEVQYGQDFFRDIKWYVDQDNRAGIVWLTGSQRYHLMQQITDSLAGRISILELPPLSAREILRRPFTGAFLPSPFAKLEVENNLGSSMSPWEIMAKGTMPALYGTEQDRQWFYRDYVSTYIERDVRDLMSIRNAERFYGFMVAVAARAGQLLNYTAIANEVDVNIGTIKNWIAILDASGIIQIVHPYYRNPVKRAIKMPKVYFMDPGLLSYLLGWHDPETIMKGPMAGCFFENYVVSEIIKSHMNDHADLRNIYFYRDRDGREVDLLIQSGQTLYPVEIKKGATPQRSWVKNIDYLRKIDGLDLGEGAVVCQCEKPMILDGMTNAIPAVAI